jgi:RsmE family RNA methyltransferase
VRAQIGSKIIALNCKGIHAYGTLAAIDRKHALINIEKITEFKYPNRPITLLQDVLKNNNNEYIVREATAIGVSDIIFFETKNTECKLKGKISDKIFRWQ